MSADLGPIVGCAYCDDRHGSRYICDALAAFLAELRRKADGHNMPTIDLGEPVLSAPGEYADALILLGLVAEAIVVPVFGVPRPGLVLKPTGPGGPLQPLVYLGNDDELDRLKRLVVETIGIARHHAAAARREAGG